MSIGCKIETLGGHPLHFILRDAQFSRKLQETDERSILYIESLRLNPRVAKQLFSFLRSPVVPGVIRLPPGGGSSTGHTVFFRVEIMSKYCSAHFDCDDLICEWFSFENDRWRDEGGLSRSERTPGQRQIINRFIAP